MCKIKLAITLIAILAVLTTASISLPAVYAKKHHLSDTQKEDSTASDAQGNPCNFGRHHDQCYDQFLESKQAGSFTPLPSNQHYGDCEDSTPDAPLGSKCIVEDN